MQVLEVPEAVAFSKDLAPSDVRVFLALKYFQSKNWPRPSQAAIAELAGVNRNTAATSLRHLVDAGVVTVDTSAAPHAYQIPAA
jgi:DNA-binding IclR family transcriptional regulator